MGEHLKDVDGFMPLYRAYRNNLQRPMQEAASRALIDWVQSVPAQVKTYVHVGKIDDDGHRYIDRPDLLGLVPVITGDEYSTDEHGEEFYAPCVIQLRSRRGYVAGFGRVTGRRKPRASIKPDCIWSDWVVIPHDKDCQWRGDRGLSECDCYTHVQCEADTMARRASEKVYEYNSAWSEASGAWYYLTEARSELRRYIKEARAADQDPESMRNVEYSLKDYRKARAAYIRAEDYAATFGIHPSDYK